MTPEFSRPVRLDELGAHERRYDIEADAEERAALARRFGLVEIGKLKAAVRLNSERAGKVVRLTAELESDVVQSCVVTLDPVHASIAKTFEVLYDRTARGDDPAVLDASEVDIEPLEGDILDIGEAVAEELALSLDPYPRAPGATVESGDLPQDPGHRPFEILARFKGKH